MLSYRLLPYLILAALFLCACPEEEPFAVPVPPPADLPFGFIDGFEATTNRFTDLFPADNSRWTTTQLVSPDGATNTIGLSEDEVLSGRHALRVVAHPSDDVVSKAGIEKGGFFAPPGSTVTLSANVLLRAGGPLEDLFLFDLECCSCWAPTVPDPQCPGVRLKLSGAGEFLSMERGKILETSLSQTEVAFPREEWVHVVWTLRLSPTDEGTNKLVINDRTVIDANGGNLPNRDAFRAEFAAAGIDFELPERVGYERVQVGATANPTPSVARVLVDDFRLEVE